jgi:hypothetical protein
MPFDLLNRWTHPLVFKVQHLLKHAWATQPLVPFHIANEAQQISFYTTQFFPCTLSCQSVAKLCQAGKIYQSKDFPSLSCNKSMYGFYRLRCCSWRSRYVNTSNNGIFSWACRSPCSTANSISCLEVDEFSQLKLELMGSKCQLLVRLRTLLLALGKLHWCHFELCWRSFAILSCSVYLDPCWFGSNCQTSDHLRIRFMFVGLYLCWVTRESHWIAISAH